MYCKLIIFPVFPVNQRTDNIMAKEKGKNANNNTQYTTQNYLLLQTKAELYLLNQLIIQN